MVMVFVLIVLAGGVAAVVLPASPIQRRLRARRRRNRRPFAVNLTAAVDPASPATDDTESRRRPR